MLEKLTFLKTLPNLCITTTCGIDYQSALFKTELWLQRRHVLSPVGTTPSNEKKAIN